MKIFVFGNLVVSKDSLPVKLLSELKKNFPNIEFIHSDPTENWWQGEKELVVIDTVVGIDKVTAFDSLDNFEQHTRVTPHDYDVYMDLQLLKKVGKVKKVTIIGIPTRQVINKTTQQLNSILKSF